MGLSKDLSVPIYFYELRRIQMICKCIKCRKKLKNLANTGLQPKDGLAFFTQGHYGSTYFDPVSDFPFGPYLEIVVCDSCVKQAEKEGFVFRSKVDSSQ